MKIGAYNNFKYKRNEYSYFYLKQGGMTVQEMREEYERLRHVAYQRLERLERSGNTGGATYQYGKQSAIPQSHIPDEDLPGLLNDMFNFLKNPLSTVTGLREFRKSRVQELNSQGFKFITTKNFDQFVDFMEYAREQGYSKIRVSTRIVELFNEISKRQMDTEDVKKDFNFWLSNIDTLEQTRKHRNPMQRRVSEYKKEVLKIRKTRIKSLQRQIKGKKKALGIK